MPKGANVTHRRVLEWSFWFAGMMDVQPSDRLYNCLPMYHSIGGIVAIGAMLVKGGSVMIRSRFSASQFWDDVVDGHCTIFQYIGELCRYLTCSPPHPNERQHHLRLACGNGLQETSGKISRNVSAFRRSWNSMPPRKASSHSTTARASAVQSVAYPPFSHIASRWRLSSAIMRQASRCAMRPVYVSPAMPMKPGRQSDKFPHLYHSATRRFDGYTDNAAAESKVLHDVFAKGDCWFRTGDLLRKDSAGYFYFVDRIGDTFRWRGENVSTTEVAEVLRTCQGVTDAVVYGVAIPGHEGRAGMAAITTDDRFDFDSLRAHLVAHLPTYAHPLFIRRCDTLDVTGTFKLTKGKLAAEGYANANDPVWFNDRDMGRFVACDAALLRSIRDGVRRL